jgi:hypothetical protein
VRLLLIESRVYTLSSVYTYRKNALANLDRSSAVPGFPTSHCSQEPRVRFSFEENRRMLISATSPYRKPGGKLSFDILRDLTAMKAAILNENLIGAIACNNHAREIETGYITFQRLRITLRAAVLP